MKEGFDPISITNFPGYEYSLHKHPETKLLVFLKGSMDVTTQNKTYHCIVGDKLIIPSNTLHRAVVGKDGCTFFWSEKLL
ncbi:MAG: AraC family ligand binding domain-containing protein [Patescibacteria group bacterium]|nr:AraC family ligand binding domain-containing protein [Patescibacteria group bacterium]